MKDSRVTVLTLAATATLGGMALTGCSGTDPYELIPRTGFITHYQKSDHARMPFESYWDISDNKDWNKRVEGTHGKSQSIYFKPVTLSYFADMPEKADERKAVQGLRDYFQQKLTGEMQKLDAEHNTFHLTTAPGPQTYTVEVALLAAHPTKVANNIAATAAGALVKGGGFLFSDKDSTGSVSMGARFYAPNGKLVAEIADYEYGQKSVTGMILVDAKDFEKYGYQRQTIDQWIDEFKQIFTTIHEHKIRKPWFTLNPL